jgi:hypothetical protein
MQTCLLSEQEERVLALSPDDRARFDEIAAFAEFEQGEIAINAERIAYRLIFGKDDDERNGYHYPAAYDCKFSKHRKSQLNQGVSKI